MVGWTHTSIRLKKKVDELPKKEVKLPLVESEYLYEVQKKNT